MNKILCFQSLVSLWFVNELTDYILLYVIKYSRYNKKTRIMRRIVISKKINEKNIMQWYNGLSEFERKVYKTVLGIPAGRVVSYQWLARKIGKPRSARAVGNVLAKNPFPLLIPCHRVIQSCGQCGKYVAGSNIKEAFLDLEKSLCRQ
jgi:O-6-methylguanine DNA methyltransferase